MQEVDLGTSGSIVLKYENGAWHGQEGVVVSGDSVRAANGNIYELLLADGFWSAQLVPEVHRIIGTGLSAVLSEDRNGYRVGRSVRLSRTGHGIVAEDGVRYQVWESDDALWSARIDSPPHGTSQSTGNYSIGLSGEVVTLSEDDALTVPNEEWTRIVISDATFPVESLFANQLAVNTGEQIVPDIVPRVETLKNKAEVLYLGFKGSDSQEFLEKELTRLWNQVMNEVAKIFPGTFKKWKQISDATKRVRQRQDPVAPFQAVATALSSIGAFETATSGTGNGIFAGAKFSETRAAAVYRARDKRAEAIFGVSGDVRHGVFRLEDRQGGKAAANFALRKDGGLGAFAYSTIPDTRHIEDIDLQGNATYRGNTTAVDGKGAFFRGKLEIEIRFGSESVFGVVTGLESAGSGKRWLHKKQRVQGIYLPEAVLGSGADWVARTGNKNKAWVSYTDPFQKEFSTDRATFSGHLLGRGFQAGHQAVGTWSVGRRADGTDYLAGSFGATVVLKAPDTGQIDASLREDLATVATAVVPAGSEIENEVLTLRGSLYGPNLQTVATEAEWDDETRVLDEGQRVEDVYELSLEQAILRRGRASEFRGRRLIDLLVEEVAQLRQQLAAIATLGDSTDELNLRASIWREVNERVRARLFGTSDEALVGEDFAGDDTVLPEDPRKWSTGYPATEEGDPDDEAALDAIDAVLGAIESPAALVNALAAGGGGVFTRRDGTPFRPVGSEGIGEIWDRAEGRIRLWTDSTDYTRFGAWRKQTAPNAWSDYGNRLEDDENGPNAFSYSVLPPARFEDEEFPAGGRSAYRGRTVAVQGETFYTGIIEVYVSWYAAPSQEQDSGLLNATISGLVDQDGLPLEHSTESATGSDLSILEAIRFDTIRVGNDSEEGLSFSEDLPRGLQIRIEGGLPSTIDLAAEPSVVATLDGRLVGTTSLGPQGVIGRWTIRSADVHRIGTGETLYGGFGAELAP